MIRRLLIVTSTMLLAVIAVHAQEQVDFDDNTSATVMRQPLAPGPQQAELSIAAAGLPFFTAVLQSFNTTLPITFVGGNPSVPGAGTTAVPTVVVPLLVNFLDGSGSLDATGIVANTIQSPIFTPVDFTAGKTDLGVTQYGDAVQRAEFWAYASPAGVSPDYHVLLGQPAVLPTVTINVPAASGHLVHTVMGNIPFGRVDYNFWGPTVFNLIRTIGATPGQMPIFLAINIGLYIGTSTNCCILGYHSSTSGAAASAQTWIYASWLSSGSSLRSRTSWP